MSKWFMRMLYPVVLRLVDAFMVIRRNKNHARILLKIKNVGKDVHLNGDMTFTGEEAMSIGDNVHIGTGAFFRAEGGLSIGNHTHISRFVTIYTHNHDYKGKALPYDNTFTYKPVVIGECVWIGVNVTVLPGAKIGYGAIIGAGCVIKGEVPPLAIVVRDDSQSIITYRSKEHYEELLKNKYFGGINGDMWSS